MDAAAFFARFAELTKNNPPHANDKPRPRPHETNRLGAGEALRLREGAKEDTYWPKPAALYGTWKPPAVKLAE